MPSDLELAWAAGFYDGEGSTVAYLGDRVCHLSASIGQVNRDNLLRFQAAVDGLGNIGSPRIYPNRQPILVYKAYGDHGIAVVRKLWPYLGQEKQDQALKAIVRYAFRDVRHRQGLTKCPRGHQRDALDLGARQGCLVCKKLRARGLAMPDVTLRTAVDFRLHGIREYAPREVAA